MTDNDSKQQQPDLLTLPEAAALLRTPVATLRYWRHLGTGPHSFRAGRRVLYQRHDLNTWIDAQQAAEHPAPDHGPIPAQARPATAPAGRR